MNREMMKEEAVKRMEKLNILPEVITGFREGIVYESNQGFLIQLNDEQKEMVKAFEEKNGALVYLVCHEYTNIGELYDFLYISKYQEEWDADMTDLEANMPFAYVVNKSMPDCSEFGSIGILTIGGTIGRVS